MHMWCPHAHAYLLIHRLQLTHAKTFYELGLGTCEVLLQKPESDPKPHSVLTYESGRE